MDRPTKSTLASSGRSRGWPSTEASCRQGASTGKRTTPEPETSSGHGASLGHVASRRQRTTSEHAASSGQGQSALRTSSCLSKRPGVDPVTAHAETRMRERLQIASAGAARIQAVRSSAGSQRTKEISPPTNGIPTAQFNLLAMLSRSASGAASVEPQNVRPATGEESSTSRREWQHCHAGPCNNQIRPSDRSAQARGSGSSPPNRVTFTRVPSNLTSALEFFPGLPGEPQGLARSSSRSPSLPQNLCTFPTVPPGTSSEIDETWRSSPCAPGSAAPSRRRPLSTPEQHAGQLTRVPHGPGEAAGSSRSPPKSRFRTINIGIEAEFYIAPLDTERHAERETIAHFAEAIAANYNKQVATQHPRMRKDIRPYEYKGPYTEWCLVKDDTLGRGSQPWGLELVSPVFRAYRGSTWREDVEAAWEHLRRLYKITECSRCSTHIHVSFEPPGSYTADDIRRIACSVIHFEPAFEALVPQSRRANRFCRSNWLDGQYLGKRNKSRSDSIAAVDEVPVRNEVQDMNCIIELMQNLDDRDYCWNFNNISWGKGTIEFRKPPASTTAEEALGWAELVMSFVQASIKNGVREKLKKVPPNVGGLKWFLKQACEPGVNEACRLDVIWKDIPDSAALEPQLWVKEYWGEESRRLEGRLNSLAMADKQKVTEFAKTAKKPYW